MTADAMPAEPIRAYVDGSWLIKGQNNPEGTGGWGAVVFFGSERVLLSGASKEHIVGDTHAKYDGILEVLDEIKKHPYFAKVTERQGVNALFSDQFDPVILYTNNNTLVEQCARKNRSRNKRLDPAKNKSPELRDQIAQKAESMYVNVRAVDSKQDIASEKQRCDAEMRVASVMARKAAQLKRLKKQGYIYLGQRLEGDAAIASIESDYQRSMAAANGAKR